MSEEQVANLDRAKMPDEMDLIFHLSEMVGREVNVGLVAVVTGEPPLPDIESCLSIWPNKSDLVAEIKQMTALAGKARDAFTELYETRDQWSEFDRFAPELERPTDALRRVGNLPMALGVSQTAAIANLRLYQTCKARLDALEKQRTYYASGKGRPPKDVRADHIAKEIAIFFARHTGKLPEKPYVHSGVSPSGKFAIALDAIFALCGLEHISLDGPARRGVEMVTDAEIKWNWERI